MSQVCNLSEGNCVPCEGGVPRLSADEAREFAKQLHSDWVIADDNTSIKRMIKFKGFAKVVLFVNALAWLAEKEGHHPDISFGYGYCDVTFSTHAIGGLSENDFICAAKMDALL